MRIMNNKRTIKICVNNKIMCNYNYEFFTSKFVEIFVKVWFGFLSNGLPDLEL